MSRNKSIDLSKPNPLFEFGSIKSLVSDRSLFGPNNVDDNLYRRISAGMEDKFEISVDPESIIFTRGIEDSIRLSLIDLNNLCATINAYAAEAGIDIPRFKMLYRNPSGEITLPELENQLFEWEEVEGFELNDDGIGNFNFGKFAKNLKSTVLGYGELLARPKFIIGFVDINPSYPDGNVRTYRETMALAAQFYLARAMNINFLKSFVPEDKLEQLREPFLIIEGLTDKRFSYEGRVGHSFAKISAEMMDITHSIIDLGQYTSTKNAGSLLVTSATEADRLRRHLKVNRKKPLGSQIQICEYVFSNEVDGASRRDVTLRENAKVFQRQSAIACAIINGSGINYLSAEEYDLGQTWLIEYGGLSEEEARTLIEKGINGISVLNLPQSGHLLLLEYQKLVTWEEGEPEGWLDRYDAIQIDTSPAIKFIKEVADSRFHMRLEGSDRLGFGEKHPLCFITVAVTPKDLVDRMLRLRAFSELIRSVLPFEAIVEEQPSSIDGKDDKHILRIVPSAQARKILSGNEVSAISQIEYNAREFRLGKILEALGVSPDARPALVRQILTNIRGANL